MGRRGRFSSLPLRRSISARLMSEITRMRNPVRLVVIVVCVVAFFYLVITLARSVRHQDIDDSKETVGFVVPHALPERAPV